MGDIVAKDGSAPVDGKVEDQFFDRSDSSDASTPEDIDIEQDHDLDHDARDQTQQQPQQQKRKGGRKPIYATSEERKQRNRQAQAAFRERRTEYIKQLENTIKIHEENLQNLQQSHRTAADECLMLRYKNSLLERVLLEKGIDVQAELQAKSGSPNLGPVRTSIAATPLSQPIQRYAVNKLSQNRRSLSAIPKPDAIATNHQTHILPQQSPQSRPIASSHLSSPALSATRSPNFLPQAGAISPSFGPTLSATQPALRPQPPLRPSYPPNQRPNLGPSIGHSQPNINSVQPQLNGNPISLSAPPSANGGAGPTTMVNSGPAVAAATAAGQFYPSPFQSHYDQLDQEYDAQAEYQDENDQPDPNAHNQMSNYQPAAPNFNGAMMPPQQHHQQSRINAASTAAVAQQQQQGLTNQSMPQPTGAANGNQTYVGTMPQMFNIQDPMLDADPFGLSASMHFPTQFSFETMR